ncbi:MAG: alpha-L-rhamnosidase C-terminal domain-containing protein [bacterium]
MLGYINEWFYHDLAGIWCAPGAVGFKKIVIRPAPAGDLTWVKAHYDSLYGRIESHWKREGDGLTMDVTIPINTTAKIYVPAKDAAGVTEFGKPVAKAQGVTFLRMEAGDAVCAVGSGTYRFQSILQETGK